MRILLLAPHPFLQDRGTPLAVDLLLRVLSASGHHVDVVTFHEGRDVSYPNVNLHRIRAVPFVRGIRPGFSWKKVVCDLVLAVRAVRLAVRGRYDVVHAVEEAVFIAALLRRFLGLRYVYDMDSSLGQQLVEKYPGLMRLSAFFERIEGMAVRSSSAVVAVCSTLAATVERLGARRVVVLHDVSLLEAPRQPSTALREELGIRGVLVMYVGNLEAYQGIDLLLESFARVVRRTDQADLVIIGGTEADVARYGRKVSDLGIAGRVHLLGPRPVSGLADCLAAADVLVSPRIKGVNTPMKIYSYLQAGRPVLATALPTHTQVLDDSVALLAAPMPEDFASRLLQLVTDPGLRARLGEAGKAMVEQRYSYPVFARTVGELYASLDRASDPPSAVPAG